MLELDNLDLDLDDDFPTGPLSKINSFESSFSSSFSWNKGNIEGIENSHKSKRSSEDSVKADFLLTRTDCVQKNEQNGGILVQTAHDLGSKVECDNNPSGTINCKTVIKFGENEVNAVNDSSTNQRILSHRKFPGPAGLLPDKPLKDLSEKNIIVDDSAQNANSDRQKESVMLCSQSAPVSSEESYKKLAADFDLLEENCPLNKYNIAWVKKKAFQKSFKGKKIPFLAVVIQHLDHSTSDPVLKLKDETGEIYGILHREVWSDLGGKLHPGAALALKQVGVLITWISKRQIYLNITFGNILNIYSYSDENILERSCINELKKSDLMKDVELWQSESSILKTNLPPIPFTTVGSNKLDRPSTSLVKVNKYSAGRKTCENDNASYTNRAFSKNILEADKSSNVFLTDDDIADFMDSLEEDKIFGEFFEKTENTHLNQISSSEQKFNEENKSNSEVNCRKRKIDIDDKNSSHNYDGKLTENNSLVHPSKLGKMKCPEKLVEPNQVENGIAEEALHGIDLNDFNFLDDFNDFEI